MSIKLEYNPRTPLAISIVAVTINKRGWKEAWGGKRVLPVLNKSVRGSIPIQRRKDIRENKRVDRSNPPRRLTPVSEKRMNYATRGMSSRSRTQIIKVASSCSSYGLHISSWNCPGENYFFREHDSSIWRQLFFMIEKSWCFFLNRGWPCFIFRLANTQRTENIYLLTVKLIC